MVDSSEAIGFILGAGAAAVAAFFTVKQSKREGVIDARTEAEHLAEIRGVMLGELRQQVIETNGRVDDLAARFERFRLLTSKLLRSVLSDLERVPPQIDPAVQKIRDHLELDELAE